MYTDNHLFFSPSAIPTVANSRGSEWQTLVGEVCQHPVDAPQVLAFCLLMTEINECLLCETNSYRAIRGCGQCALQSLRRNRSSDANLVSQCH